MWVVFIPQRKGLRQGHGAGLVQPVCRVVEKHLAAVILDEMADEIVVQIDIEGSGHGLFFSRRRRQGQCDPEGLQDAERFPEFAGFLALLQVDDKPQPRPRSQGEILLRDAQPFAGVPDHAADLLGGVFQACLQMLPYGNILVGFWRISMKCSRTGIFSQKADKKQEMLPYGNIIEIGGWGSKIICNVERNGH